MWSRIRLLLQAQRDVRRHTEKIKTGNQRPSWRDARAGLHHCLCVNTCGHLKTVNDININTLSIKQLLWPSIIFSIITMICQSTEMCQRCFVLSCSSYLAIISYRDFIILLSHSCTQTNECWIPNRLSKVICINYPNKGSQLIRGCQLRV